MIDRRNLTKGFSAFAGAFLLSGAGLAAVPRKVDRDLGFLNLHTGEQANVTYRINGRLDPVALREVDRVLRDHRTNDIRRIDPLLLDLLFGLRARLGSHQPYSVISGYRSPHTNAGLVRRSGGVAKRSLHMVGRAIDIRVPGIAIKEVHRAARAMAAGGVGLYSASDFVHLDTGRVRYWGR